MSQPHIPVLLDEVIAALDPKPGDVIVDATFGAGGYTRAILDKGAQVHAFDRDPDAIANGADEIDMVINIGALKSGNDVVVYDDIKAVRDATRGKVLKVILETSLLSNEEKVRACAASKKAGADFVKTSTGFGGGGATVEDVKLMRETVGPLMGVKASGGIRDAKIAADMIAAGATRLGTSASIAIVTDAKSEGKGY